MKRFAFALAAMLISAQAFATYYVVLKNGTQYKAKAKWTVVNGKALVQLENGQTLQLDPALIDEAKSEQVTKSGLGDAKIIDLNPQLPATTTATKQPSLGAAIKLRKLPAQQSPQETPKADTAAAAPLPAPPVSSRALLSQEVREKFARAYENVGIFEQTITPTGPSSLRAELTADSEDKVFNAISATSFLIVRNAGVPGVQVDVVELFMKTTTGGSSGRFKMTREDAEALDKKQISQQEYFVRKVLY